MVIAISLALRVFLQGLRRCGALESEFGESDWKISVRAFLESNTEYGHQNQHLKISRQVYDAGRVKIERLEAEMA